MSFQKPMRHVRSGAISSRQICALSLTQVSKPDEFLPADGS
jgi:hypothetical protein